MKKILALSFAMAAAWSASGQAHPNEPGSADTVSQSTDRGVLDIGSPAPALDIEHWIHTRNGRFQPITGFEAGKVYVIEFWATWCGPCVVSMPHLARLQDQYADQGVQIIGVSDEDLETVTDFLTLTVPPLDEQDGEPSDQTPATTTFGKLTSAYCLTTDPDRSVDEDYMAASGSDGIPNAFIVGKTGLIEWIGHPLDIDEPLAQVVHDQWDREAAKEARSQQFADKLYADPGPGFMPFRGIDQPVDDRSIYGAAQHRYADVLAQDRDAWQAIDLANVPSLAAAESVAPLLPRSSQQNSRGPQPASSLTQLFESSLILVGGWDQIFTAGAVMVSSDGLAVTNYHVAEEMAYSPVVVLTHDGKCCRVLEFIAGNRDRDVALIRIEGDNFTYADIAAQTPRLGDGLTMIHHSEERFYTFDRGYVMRHPIVGRDPWMEVSMDFAPGGSGCGIFNEQHQLVGLVSTILTGVGPELAEPFDEQLDNDDGFQDALLLVKQAVSLSAIRSLIPGALEPAAAKALSTSEAPATE